MEQINTHDRKRAEMLKSLSFAPSPTAQPRTSRPYIFGLGMTALATIVGLAFVAWPANTKTPQPAQRATATSEPAMILAVAVDQMQPVTPPATTQDIAGSGYVVAPATTDVFAKYGGVLTGLTVDLGDVVSAGQILAVLDDPNVQFALEQAQAAKVSARLALDAFEIALSQAQGVADRTSELATRGVATDLQVQEAENALHAAQNAVAQGRQAVARADLAIRIAREPVDALTIRAPISGTVTQVNATIGNALLGRADGQSLLTLTNTDTLFIDADVAETNIGVLQVGQLGEAVLDGFPDAPFEIVLARIAPVVSAAKGTVTVRLALKAPPAGIRPNMAARIRISAPTTVTH